MSKLSEFRAEKDAFFREHPNSPLTASQRATFRGLDYFSENEALIVRAPLETDGVDRDEAIAMQTTTGGEQMYHRSGVVRFEVDGEPAAVTMYASPEMHELFVPFRDATSGKETYGAGRYLEVAPPDAQGNVVVDFNDAYNPYCAYNPEWSCPIPPGENWLPVAIRAGEKNFEA
ncbi:MAG: DUF1684 domain-containing protein [Actinomycetota bacterium]